MYVSNSYIEDVRENNPVFDFIGPFKNVSAPGRIRCQICQHEWEDSLRHCLVTKSCPNCGRKYGTSFAECFLLIALKSFYPEKAVKHRDKEAIGRELDIYFPDEGIAIEFGSWHFHATLLDSDRQKREECSKRNIRLITIYDYYKKSSPPFEHDCIVFSYDIAQERGLTTLKTLAVSLAGLLGDFSNEDINWKPIVAATQTWSSVRTTSEFKELVSEINPSVIVLGEYVNSTTHIKCRCANEECGHYEWETQPNSLLHGRGCPVCGSRAGAEKRTLSHEEFLERLEEKHPELVVTTQYGNHETPVHVICYSDLHDEPYEWDVTPHQLLRSSYGGCPRCTSIKAGLEHRMTHEEFVRKLAKRNPNVHVKSRYVISTEKIQFECEHGHTWEALSTDVLNGHGCPICAREKIRQALSRSHEDFIAELAKKNPELMCLDTYVNQYKKVRVHSNTCGHEWETTPKLLLRGSGCPICAEKKRGERRQYNDDDFQHAVWKYYPDIKIISDYDSYKGNVTCKCEKHPDEIWECQAITLTSGRALGCAKCVKENTGGTGITKKWLTEEYKDKGKTVEELSAISKVPTPFLLNRLRATGLKTDSKPKRIKPTSEELYDRYCEQGNTIEDICAEFGFSRPTIYALLKQYGIPLKRK